MHAAHRTVIPLRLALLLLIGALAAPLQGASSATAPARPPSPVSVVEGDLRVAYLPSPDGAAPPQRLVLGPAHEVQAHLLAWSPDQRSVAVVSAREPALVDADLWLVQADGERRPVDLHGPRHWATNPLWSPDGTRLAYVRAAYDEAGDGPVPQLWLYDLSSGRARLLTDAPTFRPRFYFGQTRGLAWAADGRSLQYLDEQGAGEVYRVEVADGRVSPLKAGIRPELVAYRREVLKMAARAINSDMVKPLDVRDYDGTVGRGYTTVYLGDYRGNPEGSGSHPGVDIAWYRICGTPIAAVAAGVVVWRRDGSGDDPDRCDAFSGTSGGNAVVIRHDNIPSRDGYGGTVFSVYLHLRDAPTISGAVQVGDTVGLVGSTGYSTGAHLHFQLDRDNSPFHPWWWSDGMGCDVNTTVCQGLVERYTWSPMRFVQAHLSAQTATRTPSPTPTLTPSPSPTPTSTGTSTPTRTPDAPPASPTPTATRGWFRQLFLPLFGMWGSPPSD